jgi:cyclopropane fatty-acyl-phospholipid synthase-like methyltransferase
MAGSKSNVHQWASGDVFGRIIDAMKAASIDPETVTVEQMAAVDHLHACGFAASIELADALPVKAGDHLIDIGCGVGGPARYMAKRFDCRVSGLDITAAFVDAANKLTALLKMEDRVKLQLGDGQYLPFDDATFDGGYTQHVTMNVPDRPQFFGEAFRVLKPGAFFALTEHGLGTGGKPHVPCPWTEDGTGAFLARPDEEVSYLEKAGFVDVEVTHTGDKYLAGYRRAMELAAKGELPVFGSHILLGKGAPDKVKNAARNIEEGRTDPVRIICRKPK